MSLYSARNRCDEDLTMIPEIADIATEQFLKDSALSNLTLEIRIEPRPMNRRRVIVHVAPKEDMLRKPGCACERTQFETERKRHLHAAFNKVKEHLVEMRPINPYPPAAQYSKQSFYEFGPTGSAPPLRSLSVDSATTARQISTYGANASFAHESVGEHVSSIISHRSNHR